MEKPTEFEKEVYKTVKSALGEAIRKNLVDAYNSPLKGIVADAIKVHDEPIRNLLYGAIGEIVGDKEFQDLMRNHIKHKVAKEITNSFGEGIFKKSVDKLKADPTLKAKCIIAVESIITDLGNTK